MKNNQDLACDLTAIPANVRAEHVVNGPQLLQTAQEVRELPNGYSIRFSNEPGKFLTIAKFIENERLCCPFYHFGLEVEPNDGALWLNLTGSEGVKEILKATMRESHDAESLKKLIHTGNDPKLDALIEQTSFPILPSSK